MTKYESGFFTPLLESIWVALLAIVSYKVFFNYHFVQRSNSHFIRYRHDNLSYFQVSPCILQGYPLIYFC